MVKLVSANILAYGRLIDAKIRLDEKLVAVVGPNEAGKTTLLHALEHSNGNRPIPSKYNPRKIEDDKFDVIKVRYRFNTKEIGEIKQALKLSVCPESIEVIVDSEGKRRFRFYPDPERNRKAPQYLKKMVGSELLSDEMREQLDGLLTAAEDMSKTILLPDYDNLVSELEDLGKTKEAKALAELLAGMDNRLRQEVLLQFNSLLPSLLIFDDQNRNLSTEYTLDDSTIVNPPSALLNLLALAEVPFDELVKKIDVDYSRAKGMINQGNEILKVRFSEAWTQSDIFPRLELESQDLTLYFTEKDYDFTRFDMRSTGLRMFLALLAFVHANGNKEGFILLIDEAENHLHIDAQANLVETFVSQTFADKIIYTTHSPSCLPPDLGTGVRAIVPCENDQYRSTIANSLLKGKDKPDNVFPLPFLMGATAAAFSAFRMALIVEGESDFLIIPSLIKNAVSLETLPYQVVPGLAEVSPQFYKRYELLATKVVYLIDGDKAGEKYRAKLLEAGVPKTRILSLGTGKAVEDIISHDCYQNAYKALLHECNPTASLPAFPSKASVKAPRAKYYEKWCVNHGLKEPSKNAIMTRLLEDDSLALEKGEAAKLRTMHSKITSLLDA